MGIADLIISGALNNNKKKKKEENTYNVKDGTYTAEVVKSTNKKVKDTVDTFNNVSDRIKSNTTMSFDDDTKTYKTKSTITDEGNVTYKKTKKEEKKNLINEKDIALKTYNTITDKKGNVHYTQTVPSIVDTIKQIDPKNNVADIYDNDEYRTHYNTLSDEQKIQENKKLAKVLKPLIEKENTETSVDFLQDKSIKKKLLKGEKLSKSEKEKYNNLNEKNSNKILIDYLNNYYNESTKKTSTAEKILTAPIEGTKGLITGPLSLIGYKEYRSADGKSQYLPDYMDVKSSRVRSDIKNPIGGFAYDTVEGAAPIVVSSVVPGGSSVYWMSLYGNNKKDAVNQLNKLGKKDDGQADLNAGIKTSLEFITGKFLGSATKKLTGGAVSELEKYFSNKAYNSRILQKMPTGARTFFSNAYGSFRSEGTEEWLQKYLENIIDIFTLGSDGKHDNIVGMLKDPDVAGDAFYAGLVGGATGGLLSPMNGTGRETSNKMNQLNLFKSALQEDINNTTDVAKKEKLQGIINNIDKNLQTPFSIEENALQGYQDELINQNLNVQQPINQMQPQTLTQTPLNEINQGISEQNVETPYQLQNEQITPFNQVQQQITPLNEINQELQETRKNDIADSVQAMNLEKPQEQKKNGIIESAKKYNIEQNETINSINNFLNERGLKAEFNEEYFKDENGNPIEDQNAFWRIQKDSNGKVMFDKNGKIMREVILNPYADSQKTLENITIHEMFHDMFSDSNNKSASQIYNEILNYARKNTNFDEAKVSLENLYKNQYKNEYLNNKPAFDDMINEEAVADILGNKLGDTEFIESLVKQNRNIAQRFYDAIVSFLNKLNKKVGYKSEKIFWQDIKNKYAKALQTEYSNELRNNNQKYSVEYMNNEDKTPFVWLDNDLSNMDTKSQKEFVTKSLESMAGQTFGTTDGDSVLILKEFANNKNSNKNKSTAKEMNYGPTVYSNLKGIDTKTLKSEILSQLNETLMTSKQKKYKDDVNSRHADYNIKGFDTKTSLIYDGKNVYKVDMDVALLNDGTKAAYDLKRMAKANSYLQFLPQKKNSTYMLAEKPTQIGITSSHDSSVSQNNNDVKYSISKNTGKLQENGKDVTLDTSKTGNTGTLMAIHNLNEDKLKGILELGGFPVPSIAITNPSKVNHSQFGNISVLFDKNTIDPAVKANEVFDRDVWSPTFPTIEYDLDTKVINRVRKAVGGYGNTYLSDANSYLNNIEDKVNRNGIEEVLNDLKNNKAFKYVYYKNLNPDFELFNKQDTQDLSSDYSNAMLKEFADEYGEVPNWGSISDEQRQDIVNKFGEKLIPYLEERANKIIEEEKTKENPRMFIIGMAQSSVNNIKEKMGALGWQDKLIANLNKIQNEGTTRTVNDYETTNEYINDNINQRDYEKWIDDTFKGLVSKKGIYNGKEYLTSQGNRRTFNQLHDDYNLANLVKALTKQDTVGGEQGFGAGQNFGTLQAKMSNKFNSIEDIKNAENRIQYDEKTKTILDNYSETIYDYMNQLRDYSYNKSNDYYYGDNAGYALNDFASYKNQTIQNLNKALENNGINSNEVPLELKQKIVNSINDLKNIPTDYFEAKPQRAVGLDEVQQIVIPNNLDAEFKKQLQEAKIPYTEYDPNIDGDRQRVINQFDNLKFSKDASKWQEYLDKNFANTGKGTKLKDINAEKQQKTTKPTNETKTTPEKPKNISKQNYLTKAEQEEYETLKELDNTGLLEETDADYKRLQELEKKSQGLVKNYPDLKTDNTFDDIKNIYRKYKDNEISKENRDALRQAKSFIPANNQGRRTMEQWKQVAEFMGSNADIKSSADLQKLAIETWFETRPNTKDNLNRQGKNYVKFTVQDWVNSVYKGARVGEDVKLSKEETTPKVKNEINENKQDEKLVLRTPTQIEPNKIKTPKQKQQYFEESGTPPKVAKILSETPRETETSNLREIYQDLKRAVVDKGEAIYRIAKQTKNRKLYAMYDRMGLATGEGNSNIGNAQADLDGKNYTNFTDSKGNKTAMSLTEIWDDVEKSGIPENVMNEYLAHYLNVDRYKPNSLTKEETERLKELKKYKGNRISQAEREEIKALEDLAELRNVFGESVTREDSLKKVHEIEEQYPQITRPAENIWQYGKNQLQKMVDAGLVSKEMQEQFNKDTPHYVRIQRDIQKNQSPIFDRGGHIKVNNQIKKAKGGTKDIIPFKDSMAQYTLDTTSSIRRNLFGQELSKTLQNGLDVDGNLDIDNVDNNILNKNDDGSYTFTVYEDGNPKVLTIDKGIYESLQPNKHYDFEKAFTPFKKLSNLKRDLLTEKNPLFLATNFFKDFFDAPLNTKHSTVDFVKNYAKAINQISTNGELYQQYMALGGNQNTYFDREGYKKDSKLEKVFAPIEKANNFIEMLPRLSEFITSLENGESLDEAMYNAAEITTNFKRGGTATKIINRNGATFLNASVQGFDKQIRNFTEIENPKQAARLVTKMLVLGVAPALANAVMYDDDDEYEDLPDYVKDSYYLFKTGKDNKWVRIPKGRAISVIQAAARRTYDYSKGNKDAFKGLAGHFENQLAPNNPLESNVLSPLVDIKNNKSWNGSKIVSDSIANASHPEEEYDAKTDELSKWLGKKLGKSPKKINYFIDQNTGAIGDLLLPFLTKQAEGEDDSVAGRLLKNPVKDKFTTDAVLNSKQVNQFYDAFNKAEDDKKWSKATDKDKLKYKYLYSTMLNLAEYNKQIKEIEASDKSDKEKYRETKSIKQEMNEISRKAVKNSENVKIYDSYAQIDDKYYKKTYDKDTGEYSFTKVPDKQLDKLKNKGVSLVDYFNKAYEKQKKRATK